MPSEGEMKSGQRRLRIPFLPPLALLPSLALGIALHQLFHPLFLFPPGILGHAVGWPILCIGLALAGWATWALMRRGESPQVFRPTGRIVDDGPYAWSRNPIYLGFVLAYLGIGFLFNSVWLLLLTPLVVALLHYGVVVREEEYLTALFGDHYSAYRHRVRRWF